MVGRPVNWDKCLQHAALTDVGMRRANNQDAFEVVVSPDADTWCDRGHLFTVADGMGAHAAGERASEMAVQNVSHLYYKYREMSPPEAIQEAIVQTNAEIHRCGEANPDFQNMGTTSSTLLLLPQGALAAHVGDSRIYRLHGEDLQQLTFDHSLVWEMRAAGQLDRDGNVPAGVPKNVITRSLGPRPRVQVDLEGPFPVRLGDTYLLCSDGLTGKVEDEEIGPILAGLPPKEAVRLLVDLANLRGGPDNITVVVVKITGPQITTQAQRADPLTIGGRHVPKTVHPAVWILAAVCLLSAAGLIFVKLWAALLALLSSIAALTIGVLQKTGVIAPLEVALTGRRRLGKGPHTRTTCRTDAAFIQRLVRVVLDLRGVAEKKAWDVDWSTFDDLCRHAEAAAAAEDYPKALRAYASAISFMMHQLRKQNRKSGA